MLERVALLVISPLALASSSVSAWLGEQSNDMAPVRLSALEATAPASPITLRRGPDGLLHTRVVVNGRDIDMIVDTGATRSILSEADARRVFGSARGVSAGHIRTFTGTVPLQVKRADRVVLGGRTLRHVETGLVSGGTDSVVGLDWLDLVGPVTIRTRTDSSVVTAN